jgi:hypothetical protein
MAVVTITIDTGSFDEDGRLVHADDAVAQLCLALVRLEGELSIRGRDLAAVVRMRVLAADPNEAHELLDVALERFRPLGTTPEIRTVDAGRMAAGMLVAVSADVTDTTPNPIRRNGP